VSLLSVPKTIAGQSLQLAKLPLELAQAAATRLAGGESERRFEEVSERAAERRAAAKQEVEKERRQARQRRQAREESAEKTAATRKRAAAKKTAKARKAKEKRDQAARLAKLEAKEESLEAEEEALRAEREAERLADAAAAAKEQRKNGEGS
jgi:translation initiation factor IF-2